MTSPPRLALGTALAGLLGVALAATTAPVVTAAPGPAAVAVPAAPADAADPLTVRVRFTSAGLRTSRSVIAPGGTVFWVSGNLQGGEVVLADLDPGYTPAEVARDHRRGLDGRARAVRRLNREATFLGGAVVTMTGWSRFAADVPTGRYHLVDLRTGEATRLRVTGEPEVRPLPGVTAVADFVVPTEEGDRGIEVAESIPTSGWIQHTNHTDQAQMMLVDPVAESTTEESVAEYFGSRETEGDIAFRQGLAPSSLVSPGLTYSWQYAVAEGRLLLWSFYRATDGERMAWKGWWSLSRAVAPESQ